MNAGVELAPERSAVSAKRAAQLRDASRRYRARHGERVRAARRKWHAANRDKQNAKARQYRAANGERLRAKSRAKYAANPEACIARAKRARDNDPERARARCRAWAARNRERCAEYARRYRELLYACPAAVEERNYRRRLADARRRKARKLALACIR